MGTFRHYEFVYLRDACPCAMCNEEREKAGRAPGEPPRLAPGKLPMFKPAAKPVSAEGIGKYAIKFKWNDDHDLESTPGAFCARYARARSARSRGRSPGSSSQV